MEEKSNKTRTKIATVNTKKKKLLILKEQEKIKETFNNKIQKIIEDIPSEIVDKKINGKNIYRSPQLRNALRKIEKENILNQKLTKEEQWINNYFLNFHISNTINYDFFDAMKKLLEDRKITSELYCEKMMCDPNAYRRLTNEVPSLAKLTAFCIVFNIDLENLTSLLYHLGVSIKKTDPVQFAYAKLVEEYKGHSIYECNLLLKQIGIPDDYLLPDPLDNKKARKN